MRFMENEQGIWKTSDFYSAVVVKSSNIPLFTIEKENDRFVNFIFKASEDKCEEILNKHWNGDLRISSKILVDTIKELKTRLYEKVRGEKSYE